MSNKNSNISKIDKLTGRHTDSLIVAFLFIFTVVIMLILMFSIGSFYPMSLTPVLIVLARHFLNKDRN